MGIEDLKRDVAELRARIRLMTLSLFGALAVAVMAGGGADAVAKTLVEAPAWKVSTRNLAGTQTLERLVVTTDADVARVQIQNANLELASQPTQPSNVPGLLWYDSTTPSAGKLKFYNGTSWVEGGGGGGLIRAPQILTSGTSYIPPAGCNAILVVVIGGGGGGGYGRSFSGTPGPGAGGGAGAVTHKYFNSVGPSTYSVGTGGTGGSGSPAGAGGTTSFTCNSVTVTAPGGGGGSHLLDTSHIMSVPGAGGAAGTNGDLNVPGEQGRPGHKGTNGLSGAGGSTPYGGGGRGITSGSGIAGQGFGAGGSGGVLNFSNGGAGSAGAIIVYEYR